MLDRQFGWTRLILAAPNRDKNKHPAEFKIEEFLAFPDEPGGRNEMTVTQQAVYVRHVLHPYFSARAEEERRRGEIN